MGQIGIYQNTINRWIADEKQSTCGPEVARRYRESSMERFTCIRDLCISLNAEKSARVLDVGRSYLSQMLSERYQDVTTLGLDLEDEGGHREGKEIDIPHIAFDLNHADCADHWPRDEKFDLIIFSEVIEHLSRAPEFAMLLLGSLLKPGGRLICTTPNAAAIHKRIKMLMGKNPYEQLRYFDGNPGHIREMTSRELKDLADPCGLQVTHHEFRNFFMNATEKPRSKLIYGMFKAITGLIPSWRNQQIVVMTKASWPNSTVRTRL